MAEDKDNKFKNVDVRPKNSCSRSGDRRDGYVWSGEKFSWSHRTESCLEAEAISTAEKGVQPGQSPERKYRCSSLDFDFDRSCGRRFLGRSLKQKLQDAVGKCFPIKTCNSRYSSVLVSKRKIHISELMLDNCPFLPQSDLAFRWHLIKRHTVPINPKLEEDLLNDQGSEGDEKAEQLGKCCREEPAESFHFGHSHADERVSKNSVHKSDLKVASVTNKLLKKSATEKHTDTANEAVTLCTSSRKRNKPKWEMDEESLQAGTPPKYHTQIDYVHCLVPDLFQINNNPCYWGVMDRYAAEALLDGKPEGTFLLRDSAQEDYLFSVSFRRYSRSLHARIEQWNHNFSFDAHDPCVFHAPNISGLLDHYKDPSACMFFEPLLSSPLSRNFPFSLQHLSRTVICHSTTYDGIDSLLVPPSMKMYLKEYHYKSKVRVRRIDAPKQDDEK